MAPQFQKKKQSMVGRYSIAAFVLLIALLISTNAISYAKIFLQSANDDTKCRIYEVKAPSGFKKDNSTVLRILKDPEYRIEAAKKLSGAVQIDTTVHDDFLDVDQAPESWAKFIHFHNYLKVTFPNVFKTSEVTTVNTYGLIIVWKGSDETLKPLLLNAHQDVVPVQKETLQDWTHPPFAGHFDDENIYGRGSFDCKNSLIAVMQAMELLIALGYKNQRTVIAAFGFDEEIGGRFAAKKMAQYLEKRYGKDSMYALIDEGPGVLENPISGTYIAVPATGEKGMSDIKVRLLMPGGHSSMPLDHGAIVIIGELAKNIEEDPYDAILTEENPVLSFLQCVASTSGDKMGSMQRKTIFRAGFDKFANQLVLKSLAAKKLTKYLVRTSQAIDVIKGGEKINALPEEVSLLVNHRVAIGTTVAALNKRFADRVIALGQRYQLNVTAFGEVRYSTPKAIGSFQVLQIRPPLETAPVSPSTGKAWEYLAGSIRHVFEDLVPEKPLGYPIVTAPAIMPANSDTRHYWNLTRNIYRFSPMIADIRTCNLHSVNERVPIDGHLQLTAWYHEYIQTVDTREAEE